MKENGMTDADFAQKLGISQNDVAESQKGKMAAEIVFQALILVLRPNIFRPFWYSEGE